MRRGRRSKVVSGTLLLLLLPVTVFAMGRPELEFDGRDWSLGYKACRRGMEIEEYVLWGETVFNWTELVTWQYFPGWKQRGGPDEIMRQFRHRRMIQTPNVEWQVLGSDFDSVLYTWRIVDDSVCCDYFELVRIIETHDGVHIFRYAARDPDDFEHNLYAWVASFENIEPYD